MTYPHSIPLWHTNGELFPGGTPSRVVLSSVGTKWNDIVLEQHHFPSSELPDVMFKRHVIAINISHAVTGEYKKEGRFQRFFKPKTSISLFPRPYPFSQPLKGEGGAFSLVPLLASGPVLM